MTAAGLSALWSHWWRNKLQLATLLAGLALATALWSGVQAINSEARASYDAAAAVLGEGQFDQLVPGRGEAIALETYVALRRAGWQVSPVVEGEIGVAGTRARIVGVDPLTAPGGSGTSVLTTPPEPQDFLGDGVIFAHPSVADGLAARVTQEVIADPGVAPDTALMDIGVAGQILGRSSLSRLIVWPEQPMGRAALSDIAPDLVRQRAQETAEVGRLTDSFHLNLTAFGLLSFVVGLFIVHGTIGLAFEQRRGMVRTLRALGMPLSRLIGVLALEMAGFAIVAGGIGVLLGYVIAAALLPDVAMTLEGLYGAQISGALQLRPDWWLTGLGIAFAGTLIAASGALWRIAKMPLLASPGGRAWAVASGRTRGLLGLSALVLLAIAAGLIVAGQGLLLAFAGLGALLFGAALALPALLDRALALAAGLAKGVRAQWFWADTRQQVPGLSLALMALLLAAAANIGVSTMVSSFRLTFVEFLDQRLASDLYIQAEDAEQASRVEGFLQPRTQEIMPLLYVDTRLAGAPAELYGVRVGDTYKDNWGFLAASDAAWEAVAEGEAVVVNEQMARRAGLWVGDTLSVAPQVQLPIAGVFGDYGNPIGQAVVSEALFLTQYPEVRPTRFGIRVGDKDAMRAELLTFGLKEPQIIDQQVIKDFSLSVFERTFTVTAALNVLTLSVAGFAILTSLLTLAAIRVPQLAPAWAMGFTRAGLGKLELLRAVILAALTMVLAIPLGLILAWVLLAVVNVEAFGWRLPMFVFPLDYATLAGLGILAAALAALWPARRLARTPPADLLKVFSNER
ncbi:MAG: FtsX-like permease family protein [Pseudomonadota bacterium]